MECVFCKIIAGEIPSAKVYEDKGVIAFLDIAPGNEGHALVVPKKHHEFLTQVPEKELEPLFVCIQKVAKAQQAALGNQGFNVVLNNHTVAGQLVPHVHFHVIPRYDSDGVHIHWPHLKNPHTKEVAEKIKKFL
ncbi:MAG TPA: HIT family protein [Candidatus Nanoarchaeia archaeon]|nr:HIT family protein [Candidatus Nanoarchaeia archaeon]